MLYIRARKVNHACGIYMYDENELIFTVGLWTYCLNQNVCITYENIPCVSLQMEYILRTKRTELTSKLMLSGSDGLSNDLRKMDPETQARLETLLEAAGMLMFYKY